MAPVGQRCLAIVVRAAFKSINPGVSHNAAEINTTRGNENIPRGGGGLLHATTEGLGDRREMSRLGLSDTNSAGGDTNANPKLPAQPSRIHFMVPLL
jgi:hypothetical protein